MSEWRVVLSTAGGVLRSSLTVRLVPRSILYKLTRIELFLLTRF